MSTFNQVSMNKENIFQFVGVMEVMGDSPFGANVLKFYRSIRNGLSHWKVSVKAVLEKHVKCCHMNRRKSPECCGFSPFHLCFQSSWGPLKLGLTAAGFVLYISVSRYPKLASQGNLEVFVMWAYFVAQGLALSPSQLSISVGMGQVLLGSLFPTAPILQTLNSTRRLIPLSCWDRSSHLSAAAQIPQSDLARNPVLVRYMMNGNLKDPDCPAWIFSLRSE